jgi:ComEC/Rec2-related protein
MAGIRERIGSERLLFGTEQEALPAAVPDETRPVPLKSGEFSRKPARFARIRRLARGHLSQQALRTAVATEWERGTGFLYLPLFLAIGALIYFTAAAEPGTVALAAGLAVLAALAWLSRRRLALQLVFVAAALIVLGMLFAKLETWRASTKMLGAEVTTALTGRVVLIEHQANGRVRLTMDVIGTERPKLRFAPDRVRVSAAKIPAGLGAGAVVSGVVSLFPPSGPLRPDSYDFSFESYFDGIGANGFFLKGPALASGPPASTSTDFFAAVENARTTLANRIESRIGGAEGEIAAALVAGVRAGIPDDVNETLRRTGLAHVLSISGLHMALVAATIMGALRLGFAFFPGFASRQPVKKYAAAIALVAIAIYLFISGSAVAAERSFIMLAVMLAALLVDRSALTMRNLAIAAMIVLAVSPHEVAGPSFQMSFAATAALIGAYAWWSDRRRRQPSPSVPKRGLARRTFRLVLLYAGGLAATSLIAGLATTLYGAWHFHRVSPFSLPANLVAMPVVSVLVMPFAVLGMAAMPFGLDGIFFDVMGFGLRIMLAIAAWFSERSPLDAIGTIPFAAVALGTVALIVATLTTTRIALLAVPFAAAAVIALALRSPPEIFIAEDARLVGLRLEQSDALAVNRPRPNGFTVETWQRAAAAEELLKPQKAVDDEAAETPFLCAEGLCVARHASGSVIAAAETLEAAKRACATATLIVIDDATAEGLCAGGATVVSKRDLARHGSAEVSIAMRDGKPSAMVHFAIGEPVRPWHAHRVFSRAARGLPPRRPPEKAAAQ